MAEITGIGNFIRTTLTFGGVGIWTLVLMGLYVLWQGLPKVLDAMSNRVSKEAERTDREIARLEAQIVSSDKRHEECVEGQRLLREEVNRLNAIINGLIVQMRQMQISAARVDGVELSPALEAMLSSLGHVPSRAPDPMSGRT